jgi:hypothetical protein
VLGIILIIVMIAFALPQPTQSPTLNPSAAGTGAVTPATSDPNSASTTGTVSAVTPSVDPNASAASTTSVVTPGADANTAATAAGAVSGAPTTDPNAVATAAGATSGTPTTDPNAVAGAVTGAGAPTTDPNIIAGAVMGATGAAPTADPNAVVGFNPTATPTEYPVGQVMYVTVAGALSESVGGQTAESTPPLVSGAAVTLENHPSEGRHFFNGWYHVRPQSGAGGPGWINAERLTASPFATYTSNQPLVINDMVQAFLRPSAENENRADWNAVPPPYHVLYSGLNPRFVNGVWWHNVRTEAGQSGWIEDRYLQPR